MCSMTNISQTNEPYIIVETIFDESFTAVAVQLLTSTEKKVDEMKSFCAKTLPRAKCTEL